MKKLFRKIAANEDTFLEAKNKHLELYKEFKNFTGEETITSGKAKNNKSGKAHSYANYLIRLIIIFNESFPHEYKSYRSLHTYKLMKNFFDSQEFRKYNQDEHRYPSATLSSYYKFLLSSNIQNDTEQQADDDLNRYLIQRNEVLSEEIIKEKRLRYSSPRKELTTHHRTQYPRDIYQSQIAKQATKWKCEYDENHLTFINQVDDKPFMEAHHLIPMAVQNLFSNTLDFSDNIVCLCPNCHRMIHYGKSRDKKEILISLFQKRKSLYPIHGINIDLNQLFDFYQISQ